MNSELNSYPWMTIKEVLHSWNIRRPIAHKDRMEERLQKLKAYETELMERLLLVRSEMDDAESYLKVLANGQDK